jgi:hypothetical protein
VKEHASNEESDKVHEGNRMDNWIDCLSLSSANFSSFFEKTQQSSQADLFDLQMLTAKVIVCIYYVEHCTRIFSSCGQLFAKLLLSLPPEAAALGHN